MPHFLFWGGGAFLEVFIDGIEIDNRLQSILTDYSLRLSMTCFNN